MSTTMPTFESPTRLTVSAAEGRRPSSPTVKVGEGGVRRLDWGFRALDVTVTCPGVQVAMTPRSRVA